MPTINVSLTMDLYRDLLRVRKGDEQEYETLRRLIREAAESKEGEK